MSFGELPWEDNLLERKVESDLKDLLKTLVAFANSVRPGHIAMILIGERDDGSVSGCSNPDNIQKKVRDECDKIYPSIVWRSEVYEREGKPCVRVLIEFSGDTPHFGGPAWIRRGSETIKATDAMFQRLVDIRLGIVQELAKWVGSEVTVIGDATSVPGPHQVLGGARATVYLHRWHGCTTARLVNVTRFWATLENETGDRLSEPFEKLTLCWDDERDRLKITVRF